jgi:hypothetical protein
MAAGGARLMQATYHHGRGVGRLTWWGRVKRPGSGRRIGDTDQWRSPKKKKNWGWGGESLSENPPKPNPHRATNRPIRPLQKKEGGRRKRQGRGKNKKKNKRGKER